MLIINFKGNTPQQNYYSVGVKENNKANKVMFVLDTIQEDVDLSQYSAYLKVQNKEHSYIDKIHLAPVVEETFVKVVWEITRKSTKYRNLELQLQFQSDDDNEVVWQSKIISVELAETIKADHEISEKYPTFLEQIEKELKELAEESGASIETSYESDQFTIVLKNSNGEVVSTASVEIPTLNSIVGVSQIVNQAITFTRANGQEIVVDLSSIYSAISGVQENLTAHTSNTNNPHQVNKAQVGLGNVDNTSDLNKPISTATQQALDAKANYIEVSDIESLTSAEIENMPTDTIVIETTADSETPYLVEREENEVRFVSANKRVIYRPTISQAWLDSHFDEANKKVSILPNESNAFVWHNFDNYLAYFRTNVDTLELLIDYMYVDGVQIAIDETGLIEAFASNGHIVFYWVINNITPELQGDVMAFNNDQDTRYPTNDSKFYNDRSVNAVSIGFSSIGYYRQLKKALTQDLIENAPSEQISWQHTTTEILRLEVENAEQLTPAQINSLGVDSVIIENGENNFAVKKISENEIDLVGENKTIIYSKTDMDKYYEWIDSHFDYGNRHITIKKEELNNYLWQNYNDMLFESGETDYVNFFSNAYYNGYRLSCTDYNVRAGFVNYQLNDENYDTGYYVDFNLSNRQNNRFSHNNEATFEYDLLFICENSFWKDQVEALTQDFMVNNPPITDWCFEKTIVSRLEVENVKDLTDKQIKELAIGSIVVENSEEVYVVSTANSQQVVLSNETKNIVFELQEIITPEYQAWLDSHFDDELWYIRLEKNEVNEKPFVNLMEEIGALNKNYEEDTRGYYNNNAYLFDVDDEYAIHFYHGNSEIVVEYDVDADNYPYIVYNVAGATFFFENRVDFELDSHTTEYNSWKRGIIADLKINFPSLHFAYAKTELKYVEIDENAENFKEVCEQLIVGAKVVYGEDTLIVDSKTNSEMVWLNADRRITLQYLIDQDWIDSHFIMDRHLFILSPYELNNYKFEHLNLFLNSEETTLEDLFDFEIEYGNQYDSQTLTFLESYYDAHHYYFIYRNSNYDISFNYNMDTGDFTKDNRFYIQNRQVELNEPFKEQVWFCPLASFFFQTRNAIILDLKDPVNNPKKSWQITQNKVKRLETEHVIQDLTDKEIEQLDFGSIVYSIEDDWEYEVVFKTPYIEKVVLEEEDYKYIYTSYSFDFKHFVNGNQIKISPEEVAYRSFPNFISALRELLRLEIPVYLSNGNIYLDSVSFSDETITWSNNDYGGKIVVKATAENCFVFFDDNEYTIDELSFYPLIIDLPTGRGDLAYYYSYLRQAFKKDFENVVWAFNKEVAKRLEVGNIDEISAIDAEKIDDNTIVKENDEDYIFRVNSNSASDDYKVLMSDNAKDTFVKKDPSWYESWINNHFADNQNRIILTPTDIITCRFLNLVSLFTNHYPFVEEVRLYYDSGNYMFNSATEIDFKWKAGNFTLVLKKDYGNFYSNNGTSSMLNSDIYIICPDYVYPFVKEAVIQDLKTAKPFDYGFTYESRVYKRVGVWDARSLDEERLLDQIELGTIIEEAKNNTLWVVNTKTDQNIELVNYNREENISMDSCWYYKEPRQDMYDRYVDQIMYGDEEGYVLDTDLLDISFNNLGTLLSHNLMVRWFTDIRVEQNNTVYSLHYYGILPSGRYYMIFTSSSSQQMVCFNVDVFGEQNNYPNKFLLYNGNNTIADWEDEATLHLGNASMFYTVYDELFKDIYDYNPPLWYLDYEEIYPLVQTSLYRHKVEVSFDVAGGGATSPHFEGTLYIINNSSASVSLISALIERNTVAVNGCLYNDQNDEVVIIGRTSFENNDGILTIWDNDYGGCCQFVISTLTNVSVVQTHQMKL